MKPSLNINFYRVVTTIKLISASMLFIVLFPQMTNAQYFDFKISSGNMYADVSSEIGDEEIVWQVFFNIQDGTIDNFVYDLLTTPTYKFEDSGDYENGKWYYRSEEVLYEGISLSNECLKITYRAAGYEDDLLDDDDILYQNFGLVNFYLNIESDCEKIENGNCEQFTINLGAAGASYKIEIEVCVNWSLPKYLTFSLAENSGNLIIDLLSAREYLLTSWDYEVATNEAFTNIISSGSVSSIDEDANVPNLDPLTTYYVRVRGENDRGKGEYATTQTFQTTEALPVELTLFSARVNDKKVYLNWQTATEVNNFGFEIERTTLLPIGSEPANSSSSSAMAESWKTIGFVDGHGNTNSPQEYSFVDYSLPTGKVQYRLKQLDTDGNFEYSNIEEIEIENPNELVLLQNYPNPFNPETTIEYTIPDGGLLNTSSVQLIIYDILGREIETLVNEQQSAGHYKIIFNGIKLPSGMYVYQLSVDNSSTFKKLMLTK